MIDECEVKKSEGKIRCRYYPTLIEEHQGDCQFNVSIRRTNRYQQSVHMLP